MDTPQVSIAVRPLRQCRRVALVGLCALAPLVTLESEKAIASSFRIDGGRQPRERDRIVHKRPSDSLRRNTMPRRRKLKDRLQRVHAESHQCRRDHIPVRVAPIGLDYARQVAVKGSLRPANFTGLGLFFGNWLTGTAPVGTPLPSLGVARLPWGAA